MPLQYRRRSKLHTRVGVALLALLSPIAASAFYPAQLAPATPEKPWVIPSPAESVRRLAESGDLPGSSGVPEF